MMKECFDMYMCTLCMKLYFKLSELFIMKYSYMGGYFGDENLVILDTKIIYYNDIDQEVCILIIHIIYT